MEVGLKNKGVRRKDQSLDNFSSYKLCCLYFLPGKETANGKKTMMGLSDMQKVKSVELDVTECQE